MIITKDKCVRANGGIVGCVGMFECRKWSYVIGGNMVMSSQLMLSTQIQITLLYTPSNAAPQFL